MIFADNIRIPQVTVDQILFKFMKGIHEALEQLSRREPSWLGIEVADIVVGAESTVGTGASSVDVRSVWKF